MFLTNLHVAKSWFQVLQTTGRSQTAVMNLSPGQSSGEEAEAHPNSDQVLLVLEGDVMAEVAEDRATMHQGDVVVIPAGIHHRFSNATDRPVRTFSVYAPPAYPPLTQG
jgi:mannose-6-phosphate isomerase-like protein (cupin superfamily)